jgi:hypothetical protein
VSTDDDVKQSILARRARFVAAALASAGIAALAAQGCGGKSDADGSGVSQDAGSDGDAEPRACLAPPYDAGADTGPQPCLDPPYDAGSDSDPQPCLFAPFDAGSDADAEPQPCLAPPP